MHILKNIIRGLSSQLFKFSLFLMATSAAMLAVFGTPEPIKQILHDSGLYTKVVGSVIEDAKQKQAEKQQPDQLKDRSDLDLTDPAFEKVLQDAISPTFIENNVNQSLDGLFAWLKGRTETPNISVDMREPQQKLATGIAEVAYTRATARPTCTAAQLRSIDRTNIDLLNISCVPPGVDLRAEQAKLAQSARSSDELLENTNFSIDDLKDKSGQPLFDFNELKAVPVAFSIFSIGAFIWAGVALVSGGGLVLLHEDRRRGLWSLARSTLAVGVALLISVGIAHYLASQVKTTAENQNDLTMLVPGIVKDITWQLNKVILIYAVAYIVLGTIAMVVLKLKQTKTPDPVNVPTPPAAT